MVFKPEWVMNLPATFVPPRRLAHNLLSNPVEQKDPNLPKKLIE